VIKKSVLKNILFSRNASNLLKCLHYAIGFADWRAIGTLLEKIRGKSATHSFDFVSREGRSMALHPEMTPAIARMIGSQIHIL
jgi:hypothetical protein